VSAPVGFFQATTSLFAPAPGTTRPDGTPADGGAGAGGEAGLFAALLAMLAPGALPPDDADALAATTPTPAAIVQGTPAPSGEVPAAAPAPATPVKPEVAALPQTELGKTLLRKFADALKATQSALDEGKPIDPALETKLREAVDAIAAWLDGKPQLPAEPVVDTARLTEVATGGDLLPAAAAVGAPAVADDPAASDSTTGAPAAAAEPAPRFMQSEIVPLRLAELGDALEEFAARLETTSPELAKALGKLAERLSVGDIPDTALAELGLARMPGSTTPELDQLVAALTAKPATKPAGAVAAAPIAAPVLDLLDVLAGPAAVAADAPEAKADTRPVAARPPTSAAPDPRPEPAPASLPAAPDLEIETGIRLETVTSRSEAEPEAADARPVAPATPAARAEAPPSTPAPVAATAESQAALAQPATTAATARRAIHAAYSAPVQQLNYPQVAFEVARHFEAGNTRFQIRLDPADLGRIDVKLDLDKSGTVSAHMVVERPETLDLMMRDQRALQQALQQAGLDGTKTSLEFSLRQNPFGTGADTGQGNAGGGQPGFGPFGTPAADESTELAAQSLYRGSASASGVNLFV
jgi:hypothetical protein